MIEIGETYRETFSFTQQQVEEFAKFSKDTNPIHLDEAYAANTIFKKPIMHGMIGGCVISRVFGITFHGGGFIYVSQHLDFIRPMYPNNNYEIIVTVISLDRTKHRGIFKTEIIDKDTGKICTTGEAHLMHKDKI